MGRNRNPMIGPAPAPRRRPEFNPPQLKWRVTYDTTLVIKYNTPDGRFQIIGYADVKQWEEKGVLRRTRWELREHDPQTDRFRLIMTGERRAEMRDAAERMVRAERAAEAP